MNSAKKWFSALSLAAMTLGCEVYADVVPAVHREIHHMLQQQQEVSSYFQSMIDSIETMTGEQPFELHPALDLYSEWNDNFDPTGGRGTSKLADSYDIDLSGWVAPIKGRITSPYGWRKKRMHKGEDIKLYVGDTVRAAFDGRVRIRRFEKRGYGNYYVIRHENGLETIYGHLSKHIVKQDEYVKAGQAIGLGGSTGRSTGPHLHFEMRFMGIALDPSEMINFDTFEPHNPIYHLDRKRAEWAQNNKGKGSARYTPNTPSAGQRSRGTTSSGTRSGGGGSGVHVVKKGDTLGAIARKYGTTVNRLCRLNGIKANTKLQIGRKIKYK